MLGGKTRPSARALRTAKERVNRALYDWARAAGDLRNDGAIAEVCTIRG